MLIPHGTLVAVTDGKRLELLRNAGTETDPALSALPTPTLDVHSMAGGVHHRRSPANPDHHLLEEDAFAAAAADWLNREAIANRIDDLIVIAAPRTLGELRRHYHVTLKERLRAELHKEMTGRTPVEIAEELKAAR
jgi:protein required for attachment to host cells